MRLFLLFFLVMMTFFNASAQSSVKNVFKVGLIQPFYGTFQLSYERFSSDTSFSFQVSGSITKRELVMWEGLMADIFGNSIELQGRYNFKEGFKYKFYCGVFFKYGQSKFSIDIPAGKIDILEGNSKNIGVLIGYRFFFTKSRIYVDCSAGEGYHFADYSGRFSDKGRLIPSIISSGISPKLDLTVGIKF